MAQRLRLFAAPPARVVASLVVLISLASGCLLSAGRKRHGSSDDPAVVPNAAAAPSRQPQAPAAPPAAPSAVGPDTIFLDGPAPACVAEGIVQHARTVGPGMAIVACEGKTFQCVVTVVRGQIGFNCAHLADAQAPTEVKDEEVSL